MTTYREIINKNDIELNLITRNVQNNNNANNNNNQNNEDVISEMLFQYNKSFIEYYASGLSLITYFTIYSGGVFFGFAIIFLLIYGLLSSHQIDLHIQYMYNNKFENKSNKLFEKIILGIMKFFKIPEILQLKFINNFIYSLFITLLSIYNGVMNILDKKYLQFTMMTIFLLLHILILKFMLIKLHVLLENNLIK